MDRLLPPTQWVDILYGFRRDDGARTLQWESLKRVTRWNPRAFLESGSVTKAHAVVCDLASRDDTLVAALLLALHYRLGHPKEPTFVYVPITQHEFRWRVLVDELLQGFQWPVKDLFIFTDTFPDAISSLLEANKLTVTILHAEINTVLQSQPGPSRGWGAATVTEAVDSLDEKPTDPRRCVSWDVLKKSVRVRVGYARTLTAVAFNHVMRERPNFIFAIPELTILAFSVLLAETRFFQDMNQEDETMYRYILRLCSNQRAPLGLVMHQKELYRYLHRVRRDRPRDRRPTTTLELFRAYRHGFTIRVTRNVDSNADPGKGKDIWKQNPYTPQLTSAVMGSSSSTRNNLPPTASSGGGRNARAPPPGARGGILRRFSSQSTRSLFGRRSARSAPRDSDTHSVASASTAASPPERVVVMMETKPVEHYQYLRTHTLTTPSPQYAGLPVVLRVVVSHLPVTWSEFDQLPTWRRDMVGQAGGDAHLAFLFTKRVRDNKLAQHQRILCFGWPRERDGWTYSRLHETATHIMKSMSITAKEMRILDKEKLGNHCFFLHYMHVLDKSSRNGGPTDRRAQYDTPRSAILLLRAASVSVLYDMHTHYEEMQVRKRDNAARTAALRKERGVRIDPRLRAATVVIRPSSLPPGLMPSGARIPRRSELLITGDDDDDDDDDDDVGGDRGTEHHDLSVEDSD